MQMRLVVEALVGAGSERRAAARRLLSASRCTGGRPLNDSSDRDGVRRAGGSPLKELSEADRRPPLGSRRAGGSAVDELSEARRRAGGSPVNESSGSRATGIRLLSEA